MKAKKIASNLRYANLTAFILGTYLECIFGKYQKKTKMVDVDKCDKCGRNLFTLRRCYIDGKLEERFCKHCGGKIVRTQKETEPELMPPFEVDDLCDKHHVSQVFFGEDWPEETSYHKAHYISLGTGNGRGMFSIAEEAPEPKNYTPEDVQSEIDGAKKKYAKLIADCEERFDKKNVILHWGLLPCWYDW